MKEGKTLLEKGAKLSSDRIYRYRLWRYWDLRKGLVLFIGLNPSTADEGVDDPTIRRCIGFAADWGYGGLLMGNIFAFRNTYPETLRRCTVDPVGIDNDRELRSMDSEAKLTVKAWGNGGVFQGRGRIVDQMFPAAWSFTYTKQGQPKHPLYVCKHEMLVHNVIGW